jgi:uncharacterized protein involved in exopolysaccharide biosynthesis
MESNPHFRTLNVTPAGPQGHGTEEVSLIELIKILQVKWLWIVGTTLVCLILSLFFIAQEPKQYEAKVIVQIGQLSGFGIASSSEIEPVQHLIERINSNGFRSGLQGVTHNQWSIYAALIKNTKLIHLIVKARSPDSAKEVLIQALAAITEKHKILSDASEKLLLLSLQQTRDRLKTITESSDQINQTIIKSGSEKSEVLGLMLLTQLQQQLLDEQLNLNVKIRTLEASIIEQKRLVTSALEPIQVSTDPVYPKVLYILLLAMIGGVFIGIVLVLLCHAISKASPKTE